LPTADGRRLMAPVRTAPQTKGMRETQSIGVANHDTGTRGRRHRCQP
jgi:hypothetical protein